MTNYNYNADKFSYLATLLDPLGQPLVSIPDDRLKPHVHRSVDYSITLTNNTSSPDLMFMWFPANNDICIRVYTSIQGANQFALYTKLYPATTLFGNYEYIRPISGMISLRSATQSTTNVTLGGVINAISIDTCLAPNLLSYQNILQYGMNKTNTVSGALLSEGVVSLAPPYTGDFLLPANPAVTSTAFQGVGVYPSYRSVEDKRYYATGNVTDSVGVTLGFGTDSPFGRYRIHIDYVTVAGPLTTKANLAGQINIQTADVNGNLTLGSIVLLSQTITVSGSNTAIGQATFEGFTDAHATGITFYISGTSGPVTSASIYILCTWLDYTTPGFADSGSVIMVSGYNVGQQILLMGRQNFEGVPNKTLAQNIDNTSIGQINPVEMTTAQVVFGASVSVFKTIWPRSEYLDMRTNRLENSTISSNAVGQAASIVPGFFKFLNLASPYISKLGSFLSGTSNMITQAGWGDDEDFGSAWGKLGKGKAASAPTKMEGATTKNLEDQRAWIALCVWRSMYRRNPVEDFAMQLSAKSLLLLKLPVFDDAPISDWIFDSNQKTAEMYDLYITEKEPSMTERSYWLRKTFYEQIEVHFHKHVSLQGIYYDRLRNESEDIGYDSDDEVLPESEKRQPFRFQFSCMPSHQPDFNWERLKPHFTVDIVDEELGSLETLSLEYEDFDYDHYEEMDGEPQGGVEQCDIAGEFTEGFAASTLDMQALMVMMQQLQKTVQDQNAELAKLKSSKPVPNIPGVVNVAQEVIKAKIVAHRPCYVPGSNLYPQNDGLAARRLESLLIGGAIIPGYIRHPGGDDAETMILGYALAVILNYDFSQGVLVGVYRTKEQASVFYYNEQDQVQYMNRDYTEVAPLVLIDNLIPRPPDGIAQMLTPGYYTLGCHTLSEISGQSLQGALIASSVGCFNLCIEAIPSDPDSLLGFEEKANFARQSKNRIIGMGSKVNAPVFGWTKATQAASFGKEATILGIFELARCYAFAGLGEAKVGVSQQVVEKAELEVKIPLTYQHKNGGKSESYDLVASINVPAAVNNDHRALFETCPDIETNSTKNPKYQLQEDGTVKLRDATPGNPYWPNYQGVIQKWNQYYSLSKGQMEAPLGMTDWLEKKRLSSNKLKLWQLEDLGFEVDPSRNNEQEYVDGLIEQARQRKGANAPIASNKPQFKKIGGRQIVSKKSKQPPPANQTSSVVVSSKSPLKPSSLSVNTEDFDF